MDSSNPVLCNHFAPVWFSIPVQSMDPVERLTRIEESYKSSIAKGLNRFVPCVMNKLAWPLPGELIGKISKPGENSGMNIPAGLTTIPAGDRYTLLGAPVSSLHSFTLGPNAVVHMTGYTISHDNKMQLTLGASPGSVIENKEALHRIGRVYLVQELENLDNLSRKAKVKGIKFS